MDKERKSIHAASEVPGSDIFEKTFNLVPVGISHCDSAGRFIRLNKRFCEIIGYEEHELLGKTYVHITHPDDLEEDRILEHSVNSGSIDAFTFTKRYIRKDKSIVWVLLNSQAIRNENGDILYVIATIKDVSAYKETEMSLDRSKKELLKNEARLTGLLKIAKYHAKDLQDLLDYALHEIVTLTESKIGYIYLYHEKDKVFVLNTWSKEVMSECAILNPKTIYQLENTGLWGEAVRQRKPIIVNDYAADNQLKKGTPHGHVKLESFLTIPIILHDEIIAVVGVANKETPYDDSDVRQLTLLMDSVWKMVQETEYKNELIKAKEKAEESDRLKTAFLSNVSHEIRTPLNGIIGFSYLLREHGLPEEKIQYYSSIIIDNGNQLLSVIDDVLDLSEIEANSLPLNKTIVNVNTIINDVFSVYDPQIRNFSIALQTHKDLDDNEAEVFTDETMLRKILDHLVNNAFKFTSRGHIKFGYYVDGISLKFFVSDTGKGIPDDMQELIFNAFRQADTNVSTGSGGTGVGLSLAKKITHILGGEIWLKSQVGVGSVFYFTIPYQNTSVEQNSVKDVFIEKNSNTQRAINNDFTIVIAEDEECNYFLLEEILMPRKYNVLHAWNGHEVIHLCKQNQVDFILMDLKMPEMDGYEATRIVKNKWPHISIVAQSAHVLPNDKQMALDAGCNDFISKPIHFNDLFSIIDKYL